MWRCTYPFPVSAASSLSLYSSYIYKLYILNDSCECIYGVFLTFYHESHDPYLPIGVSFPELTWSVTAGEICWMGGPRGALLSHY